MRATEQHVGVTPASVLAPQVTMSYRFRPRLVARDSVLEVLLPLPVDDGYQQIEALTPTHDGTDRTDERGNRTILARVTGGQDTGFTASVRTRPFRRGHDHLSLPPPIGGDREAAPLIPLSDDIVALAEQVTRGSAGDEDAARRLFAHVRDTISYRYPPPGRGAAETLRRGTGDCGEYAFLLSALCRAAGIPARPVFGWLIAPLQQTPHVWTELWIDGAWLPADANLAREARFWAPFLDIPRDPWHLFGNLDEYRLVLSRGTGLAWPGAETQPERKAPHLALRIDGAPWALWQERRDDVVPYLQMPWTAIHEPQPGWRQLTGSLIDVTARRPPRRPRPAAFVTVVVQRTWPLLLVVDGAGAAGIPVRSVPAVAVVLVLWSAVLACGAARMLLLPRSPLHRLLWGAGTVGFALATLGGVTVLATGGG